MTHLSHVNVSSTKGLMIMDTLAVAQYTVQNNGGTFSHALGSVSVANTPDNPTHAWVVAVPPMSRGQNTVTNVAEIQAATGFGQQEIITGAVWDFIRLHHDGMSFFGTWLDGGFLYIDHVIFTTLETATRIAKERGELAIYNVATGATENL
jgi:hypothetical protein